MISVSCFHSLGDPSPGVWAQFSDSLVMSRIWTEMTLGYRTCSFLLGPHLHFSCFPLREAEHWTAKLGDVSSQNLRRTTAQRVQFWGSSPVNPKTMAAPATPRELSLPGHSEALFPNTQEVDNAYWLFSATETHKRNKAAIRKAMK